MWSLPVVPGPQGAVDALGHEGAARCRPGRARPRCSPPRRWRRTARTPRRRPPRPCRRTGLSGWTSVVLTRPSQSFSARSRTSGGSVRSGTPQPPSGSPGVGSRGRSGGGEVAFAGEPTGAAEARFTCASASGRCLATARRPDAEATPAARPAHRAAVPAVDGGVVPPVPGRGAGGGLVGPTVAVASMTIAIVAAGCRAAGSRGRLHVGESGQSDQAHGGELEDDDPLDVGPQGGDDRRQGHQRGEARSAGSDGARAGTPG